MADVLSTVSDLKMGSDGDLVLRDGDLEQVTGTEWFTQEVMKILRTNNPDWEMHPNVGADLEDFSGLPNARETGRAIEDRIMQKVTAEGIQFPGKLTVRVVPMSRHIINVFVGLDIQGQSLSISRKVFDLNDGILSDPIQNEQNVTMEQTTGRTAPVKNPYLNRV